MTTVSDHLPKIQDARPWTPHVLAMFDRRASVEEMVEHIFARGGPLELSGLGYRPQQHALALVVARRIDNGDGWALGEAPCGTGKGQAYLIPGVLATLRDRFHWRPDPSSKARAPRMVVSTANIALQSQLVEKDVPLVASLLGIRVRVGLLKGRSNFACMTRLNEALLVKFGADQHRADLERLAEYLDLNPGAQGDRDSLPFALAPAAWARASTDADGCPGSGCGHFEPADGYRACYAERSKRAAIGAEVLVVNHHLLALAGGMLGPGTLLAVDEAHALEDALRAAQTHEIRKGTAYNVARLCRPIYGNAAMSTVGDPILRLLDGAGTWLRTTLQGQGRRPLPAGWASTVGIDVQSFAPLLQARSALDLLAKASCSTPEEERDAKKAEVAAELLGKVYRRCVTLAEGLPSADEQATSPGPWAMWAEASSDGSASLGYCPADVAKSVLRLQRSFNAGALVSATLDFDATVLALGMLNDPAPDGRGPTAPARPAETIAVESPFPLADLGVLVVPHGPGTKAPEWSAWACEKAVQAARLSGGGALYLCSSRRQMDEITDALRDAELPWTILVQGELGRTELRDRFKADRDSILVATKSFFEGLDVQGDACRLVVIDKLPFDPPGDPVEDAVGALASERAGGASPFLVRGIPRACALLAQAAGRLVRSATDRGALVVLDQRVIHGSSIGAAARRALPPFPLSRDIADVGRHLSGEKLALRVATGPAMVNNRVDPDSEPVAIPLRRRSSA